jgi:ABC-type multidrug transport system fused ATPase/permease subunit
LLNPVNPETTPAATAVAVPSGVDDDIIGINAAHFTWEDKSNTDSSQRRNFRLKIDGLVRFERGAVNLIVGATGSGKTSLLSALLGLICYLRPRAVLTLQ